MSPWKWIKWCFLFKDLDTKFKRWETQDTIFTVILLYVAWKYLGLRLSLKRTQNWHWQLLVFVQLNFTFFKEFLSLYILVCLLMHIAFRKKSMTLKIHGEIRKCLTISIWYYYLKKFIEHKWYQRYFVGYPTRFLKIYHMVS